jgi:hypothetical protein
MKRVYSWLASFAFGLSIAVLTGCGGDDGGTGATASLSWEQVKYHAAITYTVHYGKGSSGGDGSCNYESSLDVSEPAALITGLEFNTQYYFAVSASSEDGHRSLCSDEASKLTPGAPPIQIGDPPVRLDSAPAQCDAERGKANDASNEHRCAHREG